MTLPPLREREDDIPLLIEYFVQKFARQQGKAIVHVPGEVMEALQRYDWPGNIRELQNVIERGVVMTTGPVLSGQTTAHIGQDEGFAPARTLSNAGQTSLGTLADAERTHIMAILDETGGIVGGPRGAAAQLGLPRTTLVAMMQRLGIPHGRSGKRAQRANRQFVTRTGVPSGASDHLSRLREGSAADFRRMKTTAAGS
jgi:transcriptional regulator with GAF, ATPase, and Fis domain